MTLNNQVNITITLEDSEGSEYSWVVTDEESDHIVDLVSSFLRREPDSIKA